VSITVALLTILIKRVNNGSLIDYSYQTCQ